MKSTPLRVCRPGVPVALALGIAAVAALAPRVGAQAQQTPANALQPSLADIPNPDPEVERASFQLADGLTVNLFAGDPMLRKPVQIAWDQRGRLWVASSETYPQIKPGEPLEDKLIVLEDTDGDGTADTSTVFADNLLIPTGLFPTGPGEAAALGFGKADKGAGCYVANSTELIFLRDTDGDGRADARHVMLSGFGTEDTHHILHTLRGGPDGSIFFNQSIYIHTHIETPWGVRRLGGGGVWNFRPETGQLEVFCRGQVNPWGHVIDRWGQSFTSDGAYSEGVNYAFPGAAFFWAKEDDWTKDFPRILKGLNPGQPKHAGIEIITGRHFPDGWQGSMVLPDFRGNRINRFVVTDQDSGYASKQVEDLIKTTHRAFRPVDLKMGPDGALYIADWYNPIIQHGEVDFRDERRDHTRGRIWRITAKDRPLVAKPKIAGAGIDELLELLKAPEDWTRFFAKREIRELGHRGDEAAREQTYRKIVSWIASRDEDDPDFASQVLEGSWATEGIASMIDAEKWLSGNEIVGPLGERIKAAAAQEPRFAAARVRRAARAWINKTLRFTGSTQPTDMTLWQYCDSQLSHSHPRVRLEAIHCLRALHTAKATETALKALDQPMDENLDFALWLTCRETQDVWLPALKKGEITFGGNFKHIVFALKATGNAEALQPLATALRDGKIGDADRPQVLDLISAMGGPAELALLLQAGADVPPARVAASLDVLAQTIRARNVAPADPDRALAFLDATDPAVRRSAARLCGLLKLEAARDKFIAQLAAPATDAPDFQAALDGLVALGGDATRRAIVSVAEKSDAPLGQRALAIQTLAALDVKDAATRATALLESEGSAGIAPALFDAFLTRKEGPAALATALAGKKLPEVIAQAGLQRAGSAGGDTQSLQDALAAAGNLKPINQTLTADEMNALVADVKATGDPHRGEGVYRRTAMLCQACHAIGGGGPDIAPNLVSIGASAQIDYLIESLLNPSAKIKEGFHTSVVTTKDGNVLAGAIVARDGQTLTLRDAAGQLERIPAQNVAKNEIMPISLMPPGLTASLRKDEFLDLVSFLSQLGREGDFKVPPQNLVRRWRVLQPGDALGRAHNLGGDRVFASADPALAWLPAYSATNGSLPPDDQPVITLWNNFKRRVAQFDLDVTTAGPVTFAVADPAGLKFISGEQIIDAQPRTTLTVPAGRQALTVFFDPGQHPGPLSIELVDDPAAAGRAQVVTGR